MNLTLFIVFLFSFFFICIWAGYITKYIHEILNKLREIERTLGSKKWKKEM